MVLMAFQALTMAAASCSTTLSDGAVKVLMPGNGSGPEVLVTGQPFLLQWTDPESELGPRVNIHLMRITSGTTFTTTGKQSWGNQPNIGYHVALEKLVNPVNVQQFKTAKHIFVVQSSSNKKDFIKSDCFTFKSASEVFTPGLSASSPGRVWEDKSSFLQDRSDDVTKKKHTVFPNEVNIPSLFDDGNVSNAGLFSALIQEVASLRRELDANRRAFVAFGLNFLKSDSRASSKHSHRLHSWDMVDHSKQAGTHIKWDDSSLELQIEWKGLLNCINYINYGGFTDGKRDMSLLYINPNEWYDFSPCFGNSKNLNPRHDPLEGMIPRRDR